MEVIIDCGLLSDERDFYFQLISQVDFGEFFGCNLDALWDYIGLLYGKKIVFVNYQKLSSEMKLFINKVMKLIDESNVLNEKKDGDRKNVIYVEII